MLIIVIINVNDLDLDSVIQCLYLINNLQESLINLKIKNKINHLICWFAVKNYAKRSFSRLKMFVIHVWYMIFKYMRKSRNFHAGLSGACSDKFSSCS